MYSLLIVSGAVIIIILRFRREVREGYTYVEKGSAPIRSQVLPTPQVYKDILQKYFGYYQQLSPQNKNKFAQKVARFIYGKRFIPRGVDEVTIEARVLIAASAVQLTFGLPNIYLAHFKRILVYPNDYYSKITKRYHKGEVNPMFGMIVLSWQSFIDGYIIPNDSRNLGLHEMAHALRLENIIRNEEYHFFDEVLLERLDTFAKEYCNGMITRGGNFFREYACTNVHEFFAVALENFFERSAAFKKEFPDLYSTLVKLLNQDPNQMLTVINQNPLL
jgi:Mlc titration factor MtfA (ptsG expression regulator)